MTDLIQAVLAWGRQGNTTDTGGHFTAGQVERLRRYLRHQHRIGNRCVTGSWRKGYELIIDNECVGVTDGHASHFVVYYRKQQPVYFLPQTKIPAMAFAKEITQ